ncbi:MAG: ErpK protein [Lachnospiraceae bacterium]|jgi:molecular chaperone GrpE (heat shock protein)|nr:ErpK protein [Lachnospiraceae bacterium]MCH4063798.1 ErpK protein [Lachnospiraceae bacterium]MCH4103479.1 ErpK protein [Lachnospiraceae bacterium]MCI1310135.1 ErpK protein [Lachnospiraceae bacterium]MCI1334589.1 ErpK protein [Lachnospiraceae bacterium]
MARSMSAETLQKKVEKVETAISRNREQYDRLTAELEELHKTQKAIQSKELMKAIADSPRSYEEILRYIQGGNDCESD